MTERKAPWESWETLIDRQIKRAHQEGSFEQLEGAGRPLPSAEAPYDPNWWTKQLMRREGVSDLPPALAIRGRVERELERLDGIASEEEVRRGLVALDAEIRRVNATVTTGPSTTVAPLDVEAKLDAWRERRRRATAEAEERRER